MRATLTQHVVHAQASLVVLLREFVVRGALLAPTANKISGRAPRIFVLFI